MRRERKMTDGMDFTTDYTLKIPLISYDGAHHPLRISLSSSSAHLSSISHHLSTHRRHPSIHGVLSCHTAAAVIGISVFTVMAVMRVAPVSGSQQSRGLIVIACIIAHPWPSGFRNIPALKTFRPQNISLTIPLIWCETD